VLVAIAAQLLQFADISGLVLPRLNSVTSWPRAIAARTNGGPRKAVPPSTRIFIGRLVRAGAAA